MRQTGLLAGAVALALCAAAPSSVSAQGRTVTGTYTTTVTTPQGALKALIVLKNDNGAIKGTLDVDGFPTAPIGSVVPSDSSVKMTAETPEGPVVVTLRFTGADKVAGTVTYQGADYPIEGTFAPSASGSAGGAAPSGALTSAADRYTWRRAVVAPPCDAPRGLA